jgi:hypothetical protein
MHGFQAQRSKQLRRGARRDRTFRRGDEVAKIDLTYSTTASISRAGPVLGTLIVCIIQVVLRRIRSSSAWQWIGHGLAPRRRPFKILFHRENADVSTFPRKVTACPAVWSIRGRRSIRSRRDTPTGWSSPPWLKIRKDRDVAMSVHLLDELRRPFRRKSRKPAAWYVSRGPMAPAALIT